MDIENTAEGLWAILIPPIQIAFLDNHKKIQPKKVLAIPYVEDQVNDSANIRELAASSASGDTREDAGNPKICRESWVYSWRFGGGSSLAGDKQENYRDDELCCSCYGIRRGRLIGFGRWPSFPSSKDIFQNLIS